MIRLGVFLLFIICFESVLSQSDTSIVPIEEVVITSAFKSNYTDINIQKIDTSLISDYSSNSLAELLSSNSNVLIKSTGINRVSNTSIRGGSSYQTAVLWNGFNIQDPLNGGFDFSICPTNFVDDIKIQYGGNSSINGSGAIGGTIHLNNKPKFNQKYSSSLSYNNGSFGKHYISPDIGYSSEKFSTRFRVFSSKSKNNFEFENTATYGHPIDTFDNASIKQYGFLQENYYKISSRQIISTHFWYQNNYRDIPKNMSTSTIDLNTIGENQTDEWYRFALNWNKKSEKIYYEARSGLFYTKMNYIIPLLLLNTNHSSLNSITEFISSLKHIKNHDISLGVNNNYTISVSDNFVDNKYQNKAALFVSYKTTSIKNLTLNANIRDEIVNSLIKPITFGFSGKYKLLNYFHLTSSFTKNHRVPTLNDLYWTGALDSGNPNLKDEHGYSKDIGIFFSLKNNTRTITSSISYYNNIISDMINWVPPDPLDSSDFPEGRKFWAPINRRKVEAKGVEYMFNSYYKISNKTALKFNLTYTYNDSRIIEKNDHESNSILNSQLVYIPRNQATSLISIIYKNVSLSTNFEFTGKRFTKTDNSSYIDAYVLNRLRFQYKHNDELNSLTAFCTINNVFNKTYMLMDLYPMPGINYEIGIKIIMK